MGSDKSQLPPYFGKDRAGAHISVISSTEIAAKDGTKIPEIEKQYTFRLVHADQVKPEGWKGVDQVQFVTVSCNDLETMRKSNGFSPKIADHDFHLTFGIQPA